MRIRVNYTQTRILTSYTRSRILPPWINSHARHSRLALSSVVYDATWLAWENAIPVSLSLPLREDRFIVAPVIAVFDNLLPDNGAIRRRLAERAGAEGQDAYSLLTAVGRDCVGALQFLPDGMEP